MGNSPSFGLGVRETHSSRYVRLRDHEKEVERSRASRAPIHNEYVELPASSKPHIRIKIYSSISQSSNRCDRTAFLLLRCIIVNGHSCINVKLFRIFIRSGTGLICYKSQTPLHEHIVASVGYCKYAPFRSGFAHGEH